MSDEKRRRAERAAARDPHDDLAQARAGIETERSGDEDTDAAFCRALLGQQVYIEGARLNWRGILDGIHAYPAGGVASLRLVRAKRLVNWNASGPTVEEPVGDDGAVVVPWGYVHMLGKAPSRWPAP